MAGTSLSAFENPDRLAEISRIIRHHSANPVDVRDAFLNDLPRDEIRSVLDLGCGFGFMPEALAGRLAAGAVIVGVDACQANEAPFLKRATTGGATARFICRRLEDRLDWPDQSFDLIVASYALYFFPRIIPEVARVLNSAGTFVTVTHTRRSCSDMLRCLALSEAGVHPAGPLQNFCAENGDALLAPWFTQRKRIDYPNQLVFEAPGLEDLVAYLNFKLPVVAPDWASSGNPASPLAERIRAALRGRRRIVFDKSDAAFICRGPRCPPD
jgi:SAM-dependent methyltransferase